MWNFSYYICYWSICWILHLCDKIHFTWVNWQAYMYATNSIIFSDIIEVCFSIIWMCLGQTHLQKMMSKSTVILKAFLWLIMTNPIYSCYFLPWHMHGNIKKYMACNGHANLCFLADRKLLPSWQLIIWKFAFVYLIISDGYKPSEMM